MTRKHFIKGFICIAICICSFLGYMPMEAQILPMGLKPTGKTVRIGVNKIEGFLDYDSDENVVGYGQDYLRAVASITGWNYEYVELEDTKDGEEKLADKEIDLLAPCQKSAQKLETYDFSAYSLGTEYTMLVTQKEDETFYYEDFEKLRGITVAVVQDSLATEYFTRYMKENKFAVNMRYYATPEEVLHALDNGVVDAAVSNLMMCGEKYKILARFSPNPIYFATWKGNDELLAELDDAMQNIKASYPDLESELMQTYYPVYNYQFFSAKDREFIASHGTVRVGYVQGNAPVSDCDEKTGELSGISRDIFDRIQEISGLQFEYVPIGSGTIGYSYIQDNQIDLITGVEYNNVNRNTTGMVMSNSYFSSRRIFVGKKNLKFSKSDSLKVAISTGSKTLPKVIVQEYPGFDIAEYDTVEECFEAVRKGDADLLMTNQYVAENWLDRPEYEGMGIVPAEGIETKLCFATILFENKDASQEVQLINIINKALSQITDEEMDDIIISQMDANKYQYTLGDFFYHYRFMLVTGGILLVIIAGALIYIYSLRARAEALQKEEERRTFLQQKRYQLVFEHSNDLLYEIGINEESLMSTAQIREKFGWEIPKKIDEFNVQNFMKVLHVHPEDELVVKKAFYHMIEEKKATEEQLRVQTGDGEDIWCKVTCLPLYDANEQLVSVVGKIEDVDCEVKEKEQLEIQSRTDGLTGLLNKRTFYEETVAYLDAASAAATGMIFVDLDHFKDVNDTLGHAMGDYAIQKEARKLQVIFANYDLVSRFGGDEYCIFVKDIPKETFQEKLARTVSKLEEVFSDEKAQVRVTASVGAIYCRREKITYDEMFQLADEAVYEAKRRGRNCYVLKEEK